MAGRFYAMPQEFREAPVLAPVSTGGQELTPDKNVGIINRGRQTLCDKFDGFDYRIPPGLSIIPYAAARHFQARLIVPGTRNPEAGTEESFIGIPGVDDPDLCRPLTDEECARAGQAVEAIDRAGLTSPLDRDVTVIKNAGAGRPNRRGGGRRPQLDATEQVSDAAREAAEHIFDRPTASDARRDAAAARREED